MRRVTATRVRETNSKCEVIHEVKGDLTPPTVHVKFSKASLRVEYVLSVGVWLSLQLMAVS